MTRTRVKFLCGVAPERLEAEVNEALSEIESQGYGCMSVEYIPRGSIFSVLIVYGNGPTRTTRWSERVAE